MNARSTPANSVACRNAPPCCRIRSIILLPSSTWSPIPEHAGTRACALIYVCQSCMDRLRGFTIALRSVRGNAHGPEEEVT